MMEITGWQKTSLIDFPDCISTVVFTQGCNFQCPYCHNPELIPFETDRPLLNLKHFWQFLEERSSLLDGVVITGGEPLFQEELPQFIREVKARDYLVKLDTNGSRPALLTELVQNELVDYLSMDIKASLDKYNIFTDDGEIDQKIRTSLKLLLESNIDYELRTTVVPGLHSEEDIKEISELIKGADRYYIQNFRPEQTFDPDYEQKQRFPESRLEDFREVAGSILDNVLVRD